jgi:hypothetical protein
VQVQRVLERIDGPFEVAARRGGHAASHDDNGK